MGRNIKKKLLGALAKSIGLSQKQGYCQRKADAHGSISEAFFIRLSAMLGQFFWPPVSESRCVSPPLPRVRGPCSFGQFYEFSMSSKKVPFPPEQLKLHTRP